MRPVQGFSRIFLPAMIALVTLVPITVHAQLQPPSIPFVPVDNVPDPDDDYLLMLVPIFISPNCQVPVSPQFSNGQPLYAGQVITLTVFCSHSPPTYVWRLNGVVIPNATTATITFTVPSGMSSAVFTVNVNGTTVPYRNGFTRAISILPAPNQTITFGVLPSRLLTDPPFNVAATASSGLPVTFSTTTPAFCSVNGVSVTLNAIGACTILASQAGNATTTAAVPVSRSFEVEPEIYYVHADHLGTPRAITRPSDNAKVWEWKNDDPFGANLPNENPSDLGNFKYNNRFQGQYYDEETGTHQNWMRDYVPGLGSYAQSDPIGLRGGPSTYGYVGGNPLSFTDPYGLQALPLPPMPPIPVPVPPGGFGGSDGSGGWSLPGFELRDWWYLLFNDRTIPKPKKPACGCTCICRADANDNMPGNIKPGDKTFAFGEATEDSCAKASKEAKRNATRNLGKQPKHIDCNCTN